MPTIYGRLLPAASWKKEDEPDIDVYLEQYQNMMPFLEFHVDLRKRLVFFGYKGTDLSDSIRKEIDALVPGSTSFIGVRCDLSIS